VLLVVGFTIPQMPWEPFISRGWPNLFSNVALTQNLTYSVPVLAPLWSLPVEVQMYLTLPALYLLYRRWPTTALLIGVGIIMVIAALIHPLAAGRLTVLLFGPCFLAGLAAFNVSRSRAPMLASWLWPIALAAVITGYLVIQIAVPTMHPPALGWGLCLSVGLLVPLFREVEAVWVTRPAFYVSAIPTASTWRTFR